MRYVFDLDGTLCTQPERGDYGNAEPYPQRIHYVNRLYDFGNEIIIETARGSESGIDWTELTEQQLDSWGVKYHKIRAGTKFAADMYIDDKGKNATDFFGDIK